MDMSGMSDPGMDMSMSMPMKMKHSMWMWFHTTVDDTVLFDFWTVKNAGQMVYTCAIVLVMSVIFEFVKYFRWRLEVKQHNTHRHLNTNYGQRLFEGHHIFQTLLFSIQLILGYMLMLIFMTFSIWLGITVCLGLGVGHFLFGARQEARAGAAQESDDMH